MAATVHSPLARAGLASRPSLELIEGGRSPRVRRVYRRRRAVAMSGLVTFVALATFGVLHLAGSAAHLWGHDPAAAGGAGRRSGSVVVVRPGDTLWSIAARTTHGDPRPLVDELQAAHGPAPLQPGERITIAP